MIRSLGAPRSAVDEAHEAPSGAAAAGSADGPAGGPVAGGPSRAGSVLGRCRTLVRPALVEAVGTLHPWVGEMAGYALGWADAAGTADPGASEGKGLRGALAVLGAEAVGAPGESGVPGAVAVELVHTFSLLHDDLMDGDTARRGRAAAWRAFGTGPAVLAGDALHVLAVEALARADGPAAFAAVRRLSAALTTLVSGQADDLLLEHRPWTGPDAVPPEEYRSVAERKTGVLLGCALALGAELGGAPPGTVAALDRAGRHLGVAFQIVDDLLGVWGDPALTGKPVGGDLRRGKKTRPVLAALADGGPRSRELAALLGRPDPMDDETAARAAALAEAAGGRATARAEADRHLGLARARLTAARLDPASVRDLDAVIGALYHRSR
ncbi:polyprenyl synthetase family protein [Streptomyces sp. ODS05-4]|uniref:polyprenyl synthetase family protein n=1 Tax=Streptomyces sp. ODS05-4 TaxID=2944939 RepID=UPI00210AD7D0|nr:polyprenyl synthetase family protein [Streptomyces sp. ODS05-4]